MVLERRVLEWRYICTQVCQNVPGPQIGLSQSLSQSQSQSQSQMRECPKFWGGACPPKFSTLPHLALALTLTLTETLTETDLRVPKRLTNVSFRLSYVLGLAVNRWEGERGHCDDPHGRFGGCDGHCN